MEGIEVEVADDDDHESEVLKQVKSSNTLPDGFPCDFFDEDEEMATLESFVGVADGALLTPAQAAENCPPGDGGTIWHAQLVIEKKNVKPLRASPVIAVDDFFSALVQTEDGRWIFRGHLNDWGGLTCLELRHITSRVASGPLKKTGLSLQKKNKRLWDADENKDTKPEFPAGHTSVRATLRAPPWTARGWSAESPGFVFWYFSQSATPVLAHGEEIISTLGKELQAANMSTPMAVRAHLFGHKFAKKVGVKESYEDALTYHTNILVEWDHGRFCSVIELGCQNVVGASRGKSTWYPPGAKSLGKAIPRCMQQPWLPHLAEMRCSDVPARDLKEFQAYIAEQSGPGKYFLDCSFQYSGKVRLTHRSQGDIMRYLLNYMGRDQRYLKLTRNCQYFAADFFSFIAGKKKIEPFLAILKPGYVVRSHLFLYDPELYDEDDDP